MNLEEAVEELGDWCGSTNPKAEPCKRCEREAARIESILSRFRASVEEETLEKAAKALDESRWSAPCEPCSSLTPCTECANPIRALKA